MVFSFGAFPIEGFTDAVLIVDDGEFFDFPSVLEPIGQGLGGEDAMGVEFDAFGSDGCGEVEESAGFDHALQLLKALEVAKGINLVAVAAKAEVLDAVQA